MKSYPQPTHATKPALSTWKISWTDYASRKNYAQAIFWKSVTTRRTENDTPHAEPTTCTTLFADRNQRLEVMPPNALHTAVAYRMCSRKPRRSVRAQGASGLTQCDLQQKANSGRSSSRKKMCVLTTGLAKRRPQSPNYSLRLRVNNLLWILWYSLAQ